jgi:hypothetical protein
MCFLITGLGSAALNRRETVALFSMDRQPAFYRSGVLAGQSSGLVRAGEYFGFVGLALFAFLSPFILVPFVFGGESDRCSLDHEITLITSKATVISDLSL